MSLPLTDSPTPLDGVPEEMVSNAGGRTDLEAVALSLRRIHVQIVRALAPVIGKKGVEALWRHSVFLAQKRHPWLCGSLEGSDMETHLDGLEGALAMRSDTEAVAVSRELVQTFDALLTDLVGMSLSRRLLRPLWQEPCIERLSIDRSRRLER